MSKKNYFKNDKPLRLKSNNYPVEIRELKRETFLTIEDFEIFTKKCGKFLGEHLYFISREFGILASFPWWDNVDKALKEMNISEIPLGKADSPYNDLEQGWQILIWEYIIQGRDTLCMEFPVWFRVSKDKYIEEWERILNEFKEYK